MSNTLPKKRGRKPKGGKIIDVISTPVNSNKIYVENVILHLNCCKKDIPLKEEFNRDIHTIEAFAIDTPFTEIEHNTIDIISSDTSDKINKNISIKLSELEKELHTNTINKMSNCFWCTYGFDTPTIYIPSGHNNNKYNVYGCFCSPECASSYLFEENIDDSIKYERYHLLNFIYGKIYDYKVSIKLAPSPYYLLEKYYGNLTIQEYRKLLTYERLFLITTKPLTKIYPELHEDNVNFEPLYSNKLLMKPIKEVDSNVKMNEVFNYN